MQSEGATPPITPFALSPRLKGYQRHLSEASSELRARRPNLTGRTGSNTASGAGQERGCTASSRPNRPAGPTVAMTDSGGPVAEDQTQHEFYWSAEAEPHSQRRREILSKYGPQVRALYGYDNRTAVQVRPTSRPYTATKNVSAGLLPPPSAWQRDGWRRPVGLRYTCAAQGKCCVQLVG